MSAKNRKGEATESEKESKDVELVAMDDAGTRGDGGSKCWTNQSRAGRTDSQKGLMRFAWAAIAVQIILLVLYCCLSKYADSVRPDATTAQLGGNEALSKYPFLADVHMMVFVGFGFLMMFLKRYSNSSLGLNFFISVECVEWSILVNSFFHQLYAAAEKKAEWHKVEVDIPELVEGDFAAASVMITFGAVLGKTSPLQLLIIGIIEVIFYGANKVLIEAVYGVVDLGGSMVIHAFGAYFGLAVALVIGREKQRDDELCGANRMSDLFAMIGTIFLWMLWPSFNAVLAPAGAIQHRAIVNTILSLCAACMVSFAFSIIFRKEHKLSMVDVQNATLAGGVAMGSSASMAVYPGGALGIGCIAGLLSCVGYNYVQPYLEKRIHLHDTCGVNNLHGMPGILGALISAVVAGVGASSQVYGSQLDENFPANYTAGKQGGIQVLSIVNTVVFAIVGGALTGMIIRPLDDSVQRYYDDAGNWIEEDE